MTERTKTPSSQKLQQKQTRSAAGEIAVDAPIDLVWQAVTDARELVRWFPLDAKVEPRQGGSYYISWLNEFAATTVIQVWDPPHHLQTSWSFHEEGPTQITDYYLESKGGRTVIRAVTSGFPLDASWDGWVEGTNRGWAFELRSLKHYLERHYGEPRHVVYLRRQIPLTGEEAWGRLSESRELASWLGGSGVEVFDRRPGSQIATLANDPPDALFRLSVESAAPGAQAPEIVLWLSAWGNHRRRVDQLRTQWAGLLERVFPEGTTP